MKNQLFPVLSLIFGIGILSFYAYFVWKRLKQINQLVDQQQCHASWLLIAFYPFTAKRWINYLRTIEDVSFNLAVSETENLINQPLKMERSSWLLLIEHYDHQDGSHFGSRFIPLNDRRYKQYKIITPGSGRAIRDDEIRIRNERTKTYHENHWANLSFDESTKLWKLNDISLEAMVVPLIHQYQNEEPDVEYCSVNGVSKELRHNSRFIINGSEFHMVHLPALGIFWKVNGKWKKLSLHEEAITAGNRPGVDIHFPDFVSEITFIIRGTRLYVMDNLIYYNIKLRNPQPVDRDCETIELQPGDQITVARPIENIHDTQPTMLKTTFYIDYLTGEAIHDIA